MLYLLYLFFYCFFSTLFSMNNQKFKAITFVLLLANILNAKDQFQEASMSSVATQDICHLDLIYNSSYQYSLPRKLLESFLSGHAFDHPNEYTPEELDRLKNDINELYQQIIAANPVKEKIAIITAGAPGAGKTLKLKQDLETHARQGKNYAYICPDDVCLKGQTRTYQAEIENGGHSMIIRQDAYNKWRPGSNAATHLILGNLIREKYAFYFGTTSSGPATGKFFEFLKAQGYRIRLIHVSAPDDVRWASIQKRDQTFVQTTEQDVREKGGLLPQRINDTFLKYADEIEFYYRDGVEQDARLAAKWSRNKEQQPSLGTLQIIAPDLYEKIKTIHNDTIKPLSRLDLDWEKSVEQSSQIL